LYEIVQGEAVGQWVAAETGGHYHADCSQAVGLTKEGTICAGVIYEDWNGHSVTCHMGIRSATRRFYATAFKYAFADCRVHKIIAPINSDNLRMIRLAEHMGFILEATISDAQPNGDILIYTMTANQCRFLDNKWAKM
jgi:RimJ/RimL family protein N-acetyltransferase